MNRQTDEPEKYHLYILAGQSNMDGMGYVRELPAELNRSQHDVWIYNPNRKNDHEPEENLGVWRELGPGEGTGVRTRRGSLFSKRSGRTRVKLSDRFGIELTFASRLKSLLADQKIALFKYAKGGSSIHAEVPVDWGTWDPDFSRGSGINQWSHFSYQFRRATACGDINCDGKDEILRPAGLLWLQGESDASFSKDIAEAYSANLQKVISGIRRLAGDEELPAVIGKISTDGVGNNTGDMPWAGIVQQAQEEFVANDQNSRIILPPENHGWIDQWHYDSETYLQLGRRYAEAMADLHRRRSEPPPSDVKEE